MGGWKTKFIDGHLVEWPPQALNVVCNHPWGGGYRGDRNLNNRFSKAIIREIAKVKGRMLMTVGPNDNGSAFGVSIRSCRYFVKGFIISKRKKPFWDPKTGKDESPLPYGYAMYLLANNVPNMKKKAKKMAKYLKREFGEGYVLPFDGMRSSMTHRHNLTPK